MMKIVGWCLAAALAVGLGIVASWFLARRRKQRGETDFAQAKQEFHLRREGLEAAFFKLASQSGKPRGLRWTGCEFDDAVVYARDRRSGDLSAFVAVTISFEAIEGGLMEDVEAVSNLRAGSAVFRHSGGQWTTDGRAMFNLGPAEAVAYYHKNLQLVGHEA